MFFLLEVGDYVFWAVDTHLLRGDKVWVLVLSNFGPS